MRPTLVCAVLLVAAGVGVGAPLSEVLAFVPSGASRVTVEAPDWSLIKEGIAPGEGIEALARATLQWLPVPPGSPWTGSSRTRRTEVGTRRISIGRSASTPCRSCMSSSSWPPGSLTWWRRVFSSRGFDGVQTKSFVFYTCAPDVAGPRPLTADIALWNTALVERGYIVAPTSPTAVLTVLAAWYGLLPSVAEDPGATAFGSHFRESPGASLMFGQEVCPTFRAPKPLGETGGLHPYLAFGVGYRYAGESPEGVIAFHYPAPEPAWADLPGRLHLATEGLSVRAGSPYVSVAFEVLRGLDRGAGPPPRAASSRRSAGASVAALLFPGHGLSRLSLNGGSGNGHVFHGGIRPTIRGARGGGAVEVHRGGCGGPMGPCRGGGDRYPVIR